MYVDDREEGRQQQLERKKLSEPAGGRAGASGRQRNPPDHAEPLQPARARARLAAAQAAVVASVEIPGRVRQNKGPRSSHAVPTGRLPLAPRRQPPRRPLRQCADAPILGCPTMRATLSERPLSAPLGRDCRCRGETGDARQRPASTAVLRAKSEHAESGRRRTPWPAIHRALALARLGVDPLEQAVHVEDVRTLAPDW